MSFIRRLFPETLFPHRLDDDAERRLRLAHARAEESVIEAHVRNALMFIDTLAEDMPFDRAIDTYVRAMSVAEPLASIVATRTLVELGEDLIPIRLDRQKPDPRETFPQRLEPDGTPLPAIRLARSDDSGE